MDELAGALGPLHHSPVPHSRGRIAAPARGAALSLATLFLTGCASGSLAPRVAPAAESRIVESRTGRDVSFAGLAEAARRADVLFFGENHGDPATHRAELAMLAEIGARRGNVVLSLEFFERDVQHVMDAYLAGQLPESTFLAQSRPPRRYATDYRALVELARARRWPVVGANVPRPLAAAVARAGLSHMDTVALGVRAQAAAELRCPRDTYFERFVATMSSHGGTAPPPSSADSAATAARNARYYEAQCVKDETMAESIAGAWRRAGEGALVVHYNGSFHSDRGLGTVERVRRRLPDARVLLVTAIPVDDVARGDASRYADRADYVILVPKPPASRAASPPGSP